MRKEFPIIRVPHPVSGKLVAIDPAADLVIDHNRLERECSRNPAKYGWYASLAEQAKQRYEDAAAAESDLFDTLFAKYSEETTTVTAAKQKVRNNSQHKKAREKTRAAKQAYDQLKAILPAFADRGQQLTNLSYLASRERKQFE